MLISRTSHLSVNNIDNTAYEEFDLCWLGWYNEKEKCADIFTAFIPCFILLLGHNVMQTKKVKLAAGRVRYYFNPLFNSLFSLIINMVTRRCGSIYLGIIVLYAYMSSFLCVLKIIGISVSSVVAFVYFRGWLRCAKWKARSYIGRGLVR